jgi:hypothetical protein
MNQGSIFLKNYLRNYSDYLISLLPLAAYSTDKQNSKIYKLRVESVEAISPSGIEKGESIYPRIHEHSHVHEQPITR